MWLYHALVKLVLDIIGFTACDVQTAQSFLNVLQQMLHVCQLAVEICWSLEFHELRRHLRIVFLKGRNAKWYQCEPGAHWLHKSALAKKANRPHQHWRK